MEVAFRESVTGEAGVVVRGDAPNSTFLRLLLDDGCAIEVSVEGGRFEFPLPGDDPFARILRIEMSGGAPLQAASFASQPWRWLFAPLPTAAADLAADLRNYSSRIAHRGLLLSYAMKVGRSLLREAQAEPVALAQVGAVLCYRLCDQPQDARPEVLILVRDMLEAFRCVESRERDIHWCISFRLAAAQLSLRYGTHEQAQAILREVPTLRDLARASPMTAYNLGKACLLLGSMALLHKDWVEATRSFEAAVEVAFAAPAGMARSFAAARELADVFTTCAACIAGLAAARAGARGDPAESRYFDLREAIRSTLRFKNDRFRDEVTEAILRSALPPPVALPKVLVGGDGWLFLASDRNDSIGQYTGRVRLDDRAVAAWRTMLAHMRTFGASQGFAHVHLIAPSKESVLDEWYPYRTERAERLPAEELLRVVPRGAKVLYPVELLRGRVPSTYDRGDTHWNDWGALLASRAVLETAGLDAAPLGSVPN